MEQDSLSHVKIARSILGMMSVLIVEIPKIQLKPLHCFWICKAYRWLERSVKRDIWHVQLVCCLVVGISVFRMVKCSLSTSSNTVRNGEVRCRPLGVDCEFIDEFVLFQPLKITWCALWFTAYPDLIGSRLEAIKHQHVISVYKVADCWSESCQWVLEFRRQLSSLVGCMHLANLMKHEHDSCIPLLATSYPLFSNGKRFCVPTSSP